MKKLTNKEKLRELFKAYCEVRTDAEEDIQQLVQLIMDADNELFNFIDEIEGLKAQVKTLTKERDDALEELEHVREELNYRIETEYEDK